MEQKSRKNPQVPESTDREHPDMPDAVEEPQRDPNLEDQTLDQATPGPGASKMENLRRVEEQVRVQKERADDATRPEEGEAVDATRSEEEG
jgi:hypothetical protein